MVNLEILETDREMEFVARDEFHALWLINGNDERLYDLGTGYRWLISHLQGSLRAEQIKQELRRQAEKERGTHAGS